MRLSKDNLIVLGIVVAVGLTYLLVVHRAQSAQLAAAQAGIADRKTQLEEAAAMASRVPSIVREIESMKQRYGKDWDRRLPSGQELGNFLREISSNLVQEKLANQMIQPGNPSRAALYNCLPIQMKFQGDFLSLMGFLRRVDGMTRLTRVEQLRIEPLATGGGLGIEVGMNIYFNDVEH